MENIIISLVNNGYYIIGFVAFCYLLIVFMLVRQRERSIINQDDLYITIDSMYSQKISNLSVVAGEANKKMYQSLCPKIKRLLLNNTEEKISIVIGPIISVFDDDMQKLGTNGKLKDKSCIADIHPIFGLMKDQDISNRVSIYYKTNDQYSNQSHFVISDQIIYNEKSHAPLQETTAVIITKPNIFMKYAYKKRFEKIIKDEKYVVRLETDKKVMDNVVFDNFKSI